MKKNEKIKFQIFSTDYDIQKVKDSFEVYALKDQYYAAELNNRYPRLIFHFKEIEKEKTNLKADILIIEDDVICIVKYFYLLELYAKKYSVPTIEIIVACTKAESVHFVLDQLKHNTNPNPYPKLIILDFDLQEEKDSSKSIWEILNKIEGFFWETEYLAVSGFKSLEGAFKTFESKLRNLHHRTYEKERLDDHKLMLNNLEFLLNRDEHQEDTKSAFDRIYDKGREKYLLMEKEYGNKLVESTIKFLDLLEIGIKTTCQKRHKLDATEHKIKNLKGNFYNKVTLTQQIHSRHQIINELLYLSHHVPQILNRWEFFEYQVCHHRFSKHLNCPI